MTNHLPDSSGPTRGESKLTPWLRSLDEIDGTDLPLVGGKAFRLAMLKQHGLNVPPGLVLTTAFFETQLKHARLIPLWAGSPDIAVTPEALTWLADALKTRPLSKELAQTLNAYLTTHFSPETDSFVVRSSAIDEDQHDHSFAGIHLTELGVPRSALPIAITRCWASALSRPAVEYRQAHGMSIQSIRIAVLIQPMLKPICAGVGFTINPLTGTRDEIIIEATWGLGEALVSSYVQPYFYKLANQPAHYPLLEQHAGNVPPPNHRVDPETGPLSQKELAELASQLEQIHALMGEAQDVEWARHGDIFFILQTRPVILPQKTSSIIDIVWTRGNHPEFLPELPSPLFNSLLERTQSRVISFLRDTGLEIDEFGPYVRLVLGRPYFNLTLLKRIISQVGIASGNLHFIIGHTEPDAAGGPLSVDWETAWQARRIYWRVFKQVLRAPHALKKFQTLTDETCTALHELNLEASPTTLLSYLHQHERIYSELSDTDLRLIIAISATTALTSSLIAPLTPSPVTFISTLAMQGVKTIDSELHQALLRLGRLARHDEQTYQYLVTAPDDFHDYQGNSLISSEFRLAFDEFLTRYGQRATYEVDMGWSRYQDDPGSLLRIIRQYAQDEQLTSPSDIHPPQDPSNSSTVVSWRQLNDQARGLNRLLSWRRWLAGPLVSLLRHLLLWRDELYSARARAIAACRGWDLALGQKWTDQGWMNQPEDIFWLTMEEVERTLLVESDMGITLSAIVQARKETYHAYAETTMPYSLPESQISSIQLGVGLSPEPISEVMVGLPISPGHVRGTGALIDSPDASKTIDKDTILVMPSTDPAWLPLLRLATGLIVETGGLLSHGSVIAREYGLPAVANIPDAAKRLHNGDVVLVDGSTGVVQLLEPAKSIQAENKKAG